MYIICHCYRRLWFDVGIVRYTTIPKISSGLDGLWFDVGHEDKNQQVIEHDQVDVINNIEPLIKVIRGHQVCLTVTLQDYMG